MHERQEKQKVQRELSSPWPLYKDWWERRGSGAAGWSSHRPQPSRWSSRVGSVWAPRNPVAPTNTISVQGIYTTPHQQHHQKRRKIKLSLMLYRPAGCTCRMCCQEPSQNPCRGSRWCRTSPRRARRGRPSPGPWAPSAWAFWSASPASSCGYTKQSIQVITGTALLTHLQFNSTINRSMQQPIE